MEFYHANLVQFLGMFDIVTEAVYLEKRQGFELLESVHVPAFVVVNAIYGAEVTKELSPLWIVGPLIVALYVKMFQGLCALSAFCFNQTNKIIRNLQSYYLVAYHFITHGKFRDDVKARVFEPVVAIKNANYKEVTHTIKEWIYERYLDFVESIWPYYCRTISFLKRANLI